MNIVKVVMLIVAAVAVTAIVVSIDPFKPASTSGIIRLSVTAQTTPDDIKLHTQQDVTDIDQDVTVLDNSTLDKIPVLKDAIDQAFSKFVPPPFHGRHTFEARITQDDASAIIQLGGTKVNQLPQTQFNDENFGVNFNDNTSVMEFKLDNFYYYVTVEQLTPA
ncbi:MAG: hypothetical protein WA833_04500 [Nitrosotalea sp.]